MQNVTKIFNMNNAIKQTILSVDTLMYEKCHMQTFERSLFLDAFIRVAHSCTLISQCFLLAKRQIYDISISWFNDTIVILELLYSRILICHIFDKVCIDSVASMFTVNAALKQSLLLKAL